MITSIIARILQTILSLSMEALSCPDSVATHFSKVILHTAPYEDMQKCFACIKLFLILVFASQIYGKALAVQRNCINFNP